MHLMFHSNEFSRTKASEYLKFNFNYPVYEIHSCFKSYAIVQITENIWRFYFTPGRLIENYLKINVLFFIYVAKILKCIIIGNLPFYILCMFLIYPKMGLNLLKNFIFTGLSKIKGCKE